MAEPERRRRRLRPPSSAPSADLGSEEPGSEAPTSEAATAAPDRDAVTAPTPRPPIAETPPVEDTGAAETMAARPPRTGFGARPARPPGSRPTSGAGAGGDEREAERGLRGLVGSGSSQVSVGAALRARDAARPTDAHLADADENLAIVRRNWLPREDLPRNR